MSAFRAQVVVVTGASEGIGRALCLELARQQPKLVLAARNRERLESLARQCADLGAEALVVPTDVTREADCRALVERSVAHYGRLDALVNAAGAAAWSRFDELEDLAVVERMVRLDYLGSVYPTFYALPELRRSGGRIVAIASLAGLMGVPRRAAYAGAKHAVVGFFDSLRVELRGSGVSVTVVCPDAVATRIHARALGPDGLPLGGAPPDSAAAISAERCARLIRRAMERRSRLVVTSLRGRLLRWAQLVAPAGVDAIAARAGRARR